MVYIYIYYTLNTILLKGVYTYILILKKFIIYSVLYKKIFGKRPNNKFALNNRNI